MNLKFKDPLFGYFYLLYCRKEESQSCDSLVTGVLDLFIETMDLPIKITNVQSYDQREVTDDEKLDQREY